ncbi:MAG TPA: ABC transporter permease [Stenomitos sp.]
MNNFWNSYGAEILQRTGEHLLLVVISTGVAVLIGLPLGIAIARKPRLSPWLLGFTNIVQTIPSLALFGLLIPLPLLGGIGTRTATIALILYALLPIVRNTYLGITGVDTAVIEAALGMGMTSWQRLVRVELPLALSAILAGIRTATVIGVGVATIAAAIGAGGLGVFIFRGVAVVDHGLILAGAVPAAGMAIALDAALAWLEHRLHIRS